MTEIEVDWEKFDNFFDLWQKHKDSTQLLYVIGDSSSVYIGCIGIKDGKGGLKQRYQWQYVQRSRAIFGKQNSDGQVSYAGTFIKPKKITGKIIGAAESLVQESFISKYGESNALFSPVSVKSGFRISHIGKEKPTFV